MERGRGRYEAAAKAVTSRRALLLVSRGEGASAHRDARSGISERRAAPRQCGLGSLASVTLAPRPRLGRMEEDAHLVEEQPGRRTLAPDLLDPLQAVEHGARLLHSADASAPRATQSRRLCAEMRAPTACQVTKCYLAPAARYAAAARPDGDAARRA